MFRDTHLGGYYDKKGNSTKARFTGFLFSYEAMVW